MEEGPPKWTVSATFDTTRLRATDPVRPWTPRSLSDTEQSIGSRLLAKHHRGFSGGKAGFGSQLLERASGLWTRGGREAVGTSGASGSVTPGNMGRRSACCSLDALRGIIPPVREARPAGWPAGRRVPPSTLACQQAGLGSCLTLKPVSHHACTAVPLYFDAATSYGLILTRGKQWRQEDQGRCPRVLSAARLGMPVVTK